jgi:hypothetical protein
VADGASDKFTRSGPDGVDKFVRDELVAMFFPLVIGERYGRRSGRTGPLSGTPGRLRHRSHGAVVRLEVQAGARPTSFERTGNTDANVGRTVAVVHGWH